MTNQPVSNACCPPIDSFQKIGFTVPGYACDSHAHVFGPYDKFPLADERSYTPPENGVERFIRHLNRLGFQRGVLVTASTCGTDNRSVLNALEKYPDRLRAVAVCDERANAATLQSLRSAGVSGLRFICTD
ncbi:MAG: amidohydrolase family protein [Burkholderiaceae bacterium]